MLTVEVQRSIISKEVGYRDFPKLKQIKRTTVKKKEQKNREREEVDYRSDSHLNL